MERVSNALGVQNDNYCPFAAAAIKRSGWALFDPVVLGAITRIDLLS